MVGVFVEYQLMHVPYSGTVSITRVSHSFYAGGGQSFYKQGAHAHLCGVALCPGWEVESTRV